MIKHIVMWKFKDDVKEEAVQKAGSMLKALVPLIPEIKAFEFGANFNPSEAAFDAVLVTEFETSADLETYQNHPEHVKVSKYIGSVRTDRNVVDFIME